VKTFTAKTYMNSEAVKKLTDPRFYLENFCKIKAKVGGIVPFKLNNAQLDLFNTMKRNRRVQLLKARQIGFSSAVTGYLYHMAITTPGINVAIIGYNSDLTRELLDKVKTFYRTTPNELKPSIQYNSKFEITFPKLDSKIIVLPSTENVGRGYTLHAVLLTELAFWDKAEEKMTALEASVPTNGLIVVESTPNGVGNLYYRMWMQDNGYAKKEYGWWWHYTEEEIEMIRSRMDPRQFAQEYELTFLSSGRSVFDNDSLVAQRKNILNVGDVVKHDDGTFDVVKVDQDGLRMYSQPKLDHNYIVGVDTSEGVEGGDFSGVVIWDRISGEEVAFFKGLVTPDRIATLLNKWGRFYNNALMVVEVNNHGLTTLTLLKQFLYPTIYFRPAKFDAIATPWSEKMGWKTTQVTRPLLIDDFGQAVREKEITIHSRELIDEMLTFIYDNSGKMTAAEGFHDDMVFAAAIGFQGFKTMYKGELTQVDYKRHMPSNFSY
jgi:hypothetical protein